MTDKQLYGVEYRKKFQKLTCQLSEDEFDKYNNYLKEEGKKQYFVNTQILRFWLKLKENNISLDEAEDKLLGE